MNLTLTKEERALLDSIAMDHHSTHLPRHHEAVHEYENAKEKLALTTSRFDESMAALRAVVRNMITRKGLNPDLFSWHWDEAGKTIVIEKVI